MTDEEYVRDVEEVKLSASCYQLKHKPTGVTVMGRTLSDAKQHLHKEVTVRESKQLHLIAWDVRVDRRWAPIYTVGLRARIDQEPIPPVGVAINVTFDSEPAALDFERKVRALLEEVS